MSIRRWRNIKIISKRDIACDLDRWNDLARGSCPMDTCALNPDYCIEELTDPHLNGVISQARFPQYARCFTQFTINRFGDGAKIDCFHTANEWLCTGPSAQKPLIRCAQY